MQNQWGSPRKAWNQSSSQPTKSAKPVVAPGQAAAAWFPVAATILLFSIPVLGVIAILIHFSVTSFMPPWVSFFQGQIREAVAAGNIDRATYAIFALVSGVICWLAFITAQFLQTVLLLTHFKIDVGQSQPLRAGSSKSLSILDIAKKLRWYSYGSEALIVWIYRIGLAVGGWKSGIGLCIVQFSAYAWRNPGGLLGEIISIAIATMGAEVLLTVAALTILMAIKVVRLNAQNAQNAQNAVRQSGVVAKPTQQSWGSGKTDSTSARTRKNILDFLPLASITDGQIVYTDGDNNWSWINVVSGKTSVRPLTEGLKRSANGVNYKAVFVDGAYEWQEIQPSPPKGRPQRREEPLDDVWQAVAATTVATAWTPTTESPGPIDTGGVKRLRKPR